MDIDCFGDNGEKNGEKRGGEIDRPFSLQRLLTDSRENAVI